MKSISSSRLLFFLSRCITIKNNYSEFFLNRKNQNKWKIIIIDTSHGKNASSTQAQSAFRSNKRASVLPIEELNILLLDTHQELFHLESCNCKGVPLSLLRHHSQGKAGQKKSFQSGKFHQDECNIPPKRNFHPPIAVDWIPGHLRIHGYCDPQLSMPNIILYLKLT